MSQEEYELGEDEIAEFHEGLSKNYNVLPLFEREYNDFVSIRKYSLDNNAKLRSRWHDRVMSGGVVKGGPIQMPNINGWHFHNNRTKFLPSQSLCNYPPPQLQLTPGPGVDKYGQKPIPDDMMQRKNTNNQSKTIQKKKKMPKKHN